MFYQIIDGKYVPLDEGMTLRDYFAGQALAGMLASSDSQPLDQVSESDRLWFTKVASHTYAISDAMIKEREMKQ